MESRVNYTLVGFFVVILTLTIVSIVLWLTQSLQEKPYKTYLVYMNESVAGLSIQAPVKYNGVDVGFVQNLRINLRNPQQVILTLKIEPYVPITTSTTAILMSQGLTGIAYIGLQGGKPGAKPLQAMDDERYPVIRSVPSFYVRLDQSLNSLTTNINILSNHVEQLLDKENIDSVHKTLINLQNFTDVLAGNRQQLQQTLTALNHTLQQTSKASQQLPQMIQQVNQASSMLNSQVLPQTYNTLQQLQNTSLNIQQFAKELNQNPSILIQGKRQEPLGPGESP